MKTVKLACKGCRTIGRRLLQATRWRMPDVRQVDLPIPDPSMMFCNGPRLSLEANHRRTNKFGATFRTVLRINLRRKLTSQTCKLSSTPLESSMAETASFPDSALEVLLKTHRSEETEHSDHLHQLALQIQHNLQYQHQWTNIKIHTRAPKSGDKFPRPLISGLPPKRLYMHPDEQAELLRQQSNAKDTASSLDDGDEMSPLEKPVVEWVLPTHLREKWSLRQFSQVFDALDKPAVREDKPWNKHKRVVLATLQDDSTIVYYVCCFLIDLVLTSD